MKVELTSQEVSAAIAEYISEKIGFDVEPDAVLLVDKDGELLPIGARAVVEAISLS